MRGNLLGRSRRLQIESLECRTMLSVTSTLAGGVLTITGDNNRDLIHVNFNPASNLITVENYFHDVGDFNASTVSMIVKPRPLVRMTMCGYWLTAIFSGVAAVAAMATPSSPTRTSCVSIESDGFGATTRKRMSMTLPLPDTGVLLPSWSCTPPGRSSTFVSSPAGARAPGSALTSCNAAAS